MKKSRDYTLERRIEEENDEKVKELHSQVQEIQNAALSLSHETKASNSYLTAFQGQMQTGKDALKSTVSKFDSVLQDKNNRLSIYAAGFLFLVFVILWKFYL